MYLLSKQRGKLPSTRHGGSQTLQAQLCCEGFIPWATELHVSANTNPSYVHMKASLIKKCNISWRVAAASMYFQPCKSLCVNCPLNPFASAQELQRSRHRPSAQEHLRSRASAALGRTGWVLTRRRWKPNLSPRLPESRCLHSARGEQTTGQLLPRCRIPAPQEQRV